MADKPKCEECDCELPGHYGSCSVVSKEIAEMKATLWRISDEAAVYRAAREASEEALKKSVSGNAMALQTAEFDAMAELAKQWRRIQMTPIVDDDYPAVRHDYERAARAYVEAWQRNTHLAGLS